MKKALLVFIILLAILLATCSGAASEVIGQNKDEYFELKVYADRGVYSPSDAVKCYATVEYIGDGDGITAYPLVSFSLLGDHSYSRLESEYGLLAVEYKKGEPVRYNANGFFLFAGEYKITADMSYYWNEDMSYGSGHFISASIPVKAVQFPIECIIAFIIVGIILVCFPSLLLINQKLKQMRSSWHLNDYDPTLNKEPSVEDKIKSAKLNPQKTITFGTNYFAYDNIKKKLFVRSGKAIDGVLLDYKDIVSYELIKDGQTIRRGGGGESVRLDVSGKSVSSAGDGKPLCSDLRLLIKTRKASSPEVVLPFISFSIDSEFAYNEALQAANEAAEELENII